MTKAEREKLREDVQAFIGMAGADWRTAKIIVLLDHIDALEGRVERRGNIILRAIGWVEEVHCSGEGAVQQQRSFINEMQVALASAPEVKS